MTINKLCNTYKKPCQIIKDGNNSLLTNTQYRLRRWYEHFNNTKGYAQGEIVCEEEVIIN